jgi:hypothetical protein
MSTNSVLSPVTEKLFAVSFQVLDDMLHELIEAYNAPAGGEEISR